MTTAMNDERAPRLVAFPTMTVGALLALSEAPLVKPPPGGIAYLQPDGAHAWVLRIGEKDVVFPPGLFTAIEVMEDRIVRIQSNPHLGYLGPEAAVALVMALRRQLFDAGFVEGDALGESALATELREHGGLRACRVRAGEWMGEIRAERAIEAGTKAAEVMKLTEDACLVKLVIWDIRGAAAMIG